MPGMTIQIYKHSNQTVAMKLKSQLAVLIVLTGTGNAQYGKEEHKKSGSPKVHVPSALHRFHLIQEWGF